MNIEQLHYFLQVVESGSVNAAAQKFYMTPQAINASIRKLEEEYESPLLVRSKKGVTLTPQGHVFASYAQEVMEKNEKIHLLLQAYNAQDINLSGTLSVFSASIFTETILPTAVHNFTQIFPQTNVKIMQVNSIDILNHLLNSYCDIAFLTSNKSFLEQFVAQHHEENIKMVPLLIDRLMICARAEHPLMHQSAITSDVLEDYVTRTNNPVSFYYILTLDSDGMQYPKAISSSNSTELHKKLMLENNVLTTMPKMAYQTSFQNDGFAAVPLGSDDTTIHALLYRDDPNQEKYELTNRFVRTLQKQFEQRYGAYKEK